MPISTVSVAATVVETVARSERGFEETVQGISMTPRWPAQLGGGELEIAI